MYRITICSSSSFHQTQVSSLDDAAKYARRHGKDATIYNPHGAIVATWSLTSGLVRVS